ncbi:sensor histidine kinase [Isoalcanivorax indicus]|uniref:sensor histidine kinase n=1 Tax=Isoalcanivorax indicus TaxID=2202653 RepID=UPI0013C532FC|nr:ATP-binding protein [Isoalcanivorax indicus]
MRRQSGRFWSGNLGQRSLVLTLMPLVLAATTMAVLLYTLAQTQQADDEVQRGLRALGQIHAVHAALAEAASGVRGFIITQDETFLRPYERAQDQLREALRRLERDTQDTVQLQQLAEISELVDVKLSNLATLTVLSRELSGGQMLAYSRDNKELLDRLRRRIALMEERENRIIADLQQQQRRTRQIGHASMLAAVLATFVLASLLSQRFAARLIRRIRHLRDNARRISQREPLQPYTHEEADELAELDQLLVQTGHTLYEKIAELEAARETAEEASRAKTRFLSRTSHELRTPLNAVIGFSALLKKHLELPAQRRQIDAIQHSAEHLLQLVNDLLDMSRIEAGQLTLKLESVDVPEQIARALDIVHGRAAARDIRLFREGCEALPAVVADTSRVLQVLINLLDNAAKFSSPGSAVVIRAEAQAEYVRLHVIDEGPGIHPDFHADLFRPFSRQDSQMEGVGLGLAISHGLMEAMGGTLTFAPTAHGGSCFTLQLPRSGQPPERTAAPSLAVPDALPPRRPALAPLQLLLCTRDDVFAMQIDATAQRLGLSCRRVEPGVALPSSMIRESWLLVHDAEEPPAWPDDMPPPRVCLWRDAPEYLPVLPCEVRVLAHDAPPSAWRNHLQELLDEHLAPGNA